MRTLTDEQRAKGFQSMQESMTAARRVQRRLNAGRKAPLPKSVTLYEAVEKMRLETERARDKMAEEKLNPDDMRLGLLFYASDGQQEYMGNRWFTTGKVGEFTAGLEEMAQKATLTFFGIVWAVLDREANTGITWPKQIVSGEQAAEWLQLAKGLFKTPHRSN